MVLSTEITLHILDFLKDVDVRCFNLVDRAHWRTFKDLPACHRVDRTERATWLGFQFQCARDFKDELFCAECTRLHHRLTIEPPGPLFHEYESAHLRRGQKAQDAIVQGDPVGAFRWTFNHIQMVMREGRHSETGASLRIFDATVFHWQKGNPQLRRLELAQLWSRDVAIVPRKDKAPLLKLRTQSWSIVESMPYLLKVLKTRTVALWRSNVFAELCTHHNNKDPFECGRLDNLIKRMEHLDNTTETDAASYGAIHRWRCDRCLSTYSIQLRALRNGQAALIIIKIARFEEKYPSPDLKCSPCSSPGRCKVRHHPRQRDDRVFLEYGQAYVDPIDTLSSEQDLTERLSLQNEDIVVYRNFDEDGWHRTDDVWGGKSWIRQRNPRTGRWSHEKSGHRRHQQS